MSPLEDCSLTSVTPSRWTAPSKTQIIVQSQPKNQVAKIIRDVFLNTFCGLLNFALRRLPREFSGTLPHSKAQSSRVPFCRRLLLFLSSPCVDPAPLLGFTADPLALHPHKYGALCLYDRWSSALVWVGAGTAEGRKECKGARWGPPALHVQSLIFLSSLSPLQVSKVKWTTGNIRSGSGSF